MKGRIKELLNEFALVNKPEDKFLPSTLYKIYVYGNDRELMTPHFHFFDVNKNFEIEIQMVNAIVNPVILKSKARSGIKKSDLTTWEGLIHEKELLIKWLSLPSKRIPGFTNYVALFISWNLNNPNNELELPEQ